MVIFLLYLVESAKKEIGIHLNKHKTEYIFYHLQEDIKTTSGKAVRKLMTSYLGPRIA